MTHLHELADLAETAAREAGKFLLNQAHQNQTVFSQEKKDIKLQADTESEQLIRARLSPAGLPILGEEAGGDAGLPKRNELFWIVDPLDGTHNYMKGVPLCCVSIAIFRGETPVLGVIYDFNRDETFRGIVAEGLFLNGQRQRPQWAPVPEQASLQTGFPTGRDYTPEALREFIERVRRFKKIRLIGSAALAVAWVAAGRYDVYFEEGIRLWDIAAGLALVQAAGGAVRMTPNPVKPFAYDVWAAGRAEFIG